MKILRKRGCPERVGVVSSRLSRVADTTTHKKYTGTQCNNSAYLWMVYLQKHVGREYVTLASPPKAGVATSTEQRSDERIFGA